MAQVSEYSETFNRLDLTERPLYLRKARGLKTFARASHTLGTIVAKYELG
jgi:hypothetical protein